MPPVYKLRRANTTKDADKSQGDRQLFPGLAAFLYCKKLPVPLIEKAASPLLSDTKGNNPAPPCFHGFIIIGVRRCQQDALDPRRLELFDARRAFLRRARDGKALQQ